MNKLMSIFFLLFLIASTAHASPSSDYTSYLRSLEQENISELKKYLINAEKKKYSDKQISEILEGNVTYAKMAVPQNLEIIDEKISGNNATVKVKGKFHDQDSTGTIIMIQENGIWKVLKQDWKSN